ncbi:MAG: prephenate dehydrogenase/arogenate dehydrogenase family protein [Gemmatimonadetes bacterium]|jgi:prephenate dehydrogenase|nr:prephenate dehydrogenase/arogenate dehydrogenase family protein [Gemmatimonadota bacterium]MBT6148826.1 prephenate dehydrogenase/arogenate dehydrogenase family protein [Gemmatimonadota bacterium]MBT7860389.1 prephenate dehydrogenase/arogenate dehydrogenase family protein [Gemmatimonadota bacterium]
MDNIPFQRVAILGVGLIGGSMGLAMRRIGFEGGIVGISRPATIERAVDLGAVDEGFGYDQLPAALDGVDLVFACSPIQHIIDTLPAVMAAAAPGTLVTDAGSTKRQIVAAARAVGRDDVYFLGGHPMAGSEKSGVGAADPFLFQNAIYVLIPDPGVPAPLHLGLRDLVRGVGARVLELKAESHDTVVAAISHLPQLLATSLVEMVGRLDEGDEARGAFLMLAAGGFRDMTRIASSPFAPVWKDICATNGDRIRAMTGQFSTQLSQVTGRVGDEALAEDFDYANRVRDTIPRDAKGFIHRLSEILVVCEDKPGVIAQIATLLAAQRVNINDIEVVKVREGEGGTLRLGFEDDEAADRALAILADHGYRARRP